MDLLTKSRLAVARRCQREHELMFIRGYRPAEDADALRFGTLVHAGLESLWRGHAPEWPANADPFDLAKARPMLAGYAARWDPAEYEVLGVEVPFECDLINPETGAPSRTWRLAGKLDALVRERSSGRVLVVEHKTSSKDIAPGSNYWAMLRFDTQVTVYFEGARALGHEPAACLYDVLGKPMLRPRDVPVLDEGGQKIVLDATGARATTKAGTWRQTGGEGLTVQTRPETPAEFEARVAEDIAAHPEAYYARGEVVRLESETRDGGIDTWQSAQQIREAARLGRSPRNPNACERFGRLCEFFPVCSGAESLDNGLLYRKSAPNPELRVSE